MSELERAKGLISRLLASGPCSAAAVLKVAEGAKLSVRTTQRASKAMCIEKRRGAFRGNWTWALPAAPYAIKEPPGDGGVSNRDRAVVIAARLRRLETSRGQVAPIHASDPRLLRWVQAGIRDPDLREAYDRALFALRVDRPVTVGYLDRFVTAVMAEAMA